MKQENKKETYDPEISKGARRKNSKIRNQHLKKNSQLNTFTTK